MSHAEFEDAIHKIDVLAEVDFESLRYGVRIRPSHPRYFDALYKRAAEVRPIGALVSVMRERDCFVTTEYVPPALTWRQRLHLFFHGRFRASVGL